MPVVDLDNTATLRYIHPYPRFQHQPITPARDARAAAAVIALTISRERDNMPSTRVAFGARNYSIPAGSSKD